LPVVYELTMMDRMGASIDGDCPGPADAPREQRSEGSDTPDPDDHELNCRYLKDLEEQQAKDAKVLANRLPDEDSTDQSNPEPEADDSTDQSAAASEDEDATEDSQVEVQPEDESLFSEIEHRSIIESAKACIEFLERRLVAVAANHVLPVLGEHVVNVAFELWDLASSARAFDSDEPVADVPLPSPFSGLDLSVKIQLSSGVDGQTTPPLAVCVGPDSPSLTGGWALEAGEDGNPQARPPADDTEADLERLYAQQEPVVRPIDTGYPAQPRPSVGRRPATACLMEIDLDSLPLPQHREIRAWALAVLAAEYAPELRNIPELRRFEAFIIADNGRRCGLWIWREALETDGLDS
jgi:hypothetical protein